MRQNWIQVKLEQVCDFLGGGTPSKKEPSFWGGEIPWASIKDMKGDELTQTQDSITKKGLSNSASNVAHKGEIILATRIAPGKPILSKIDVAINQDLKIVKPKIDVEVSYLFYGFKSLEKNIQRISSGTTVLGINLNNLKSLNFPLAPLPEQRAIVAKIEALFSEVDQGIADLKKAQDQLKVYRQGVLKKAFEGELTKEWRALRQAQGPPLPTADELVEQIKEERRKHYEKQLEDWKEAVKDWEENGKKGKKPGKPRQAKELERANEILHPLPSNWKWVKLGNIADKVSDGPFGSNLKTSDYVDSGVRVIRLENIGNLIFRDSKKSFVSFAKFECLKNHTVLPKDVIFSSFIAEEISVVSIPNHVERAINKADCFCVRFGSHIYFRFYEFFLSTRSTYTQLVNEVHGATRPRINTTQLKEVIVPLCSIEEQHQIVREIESRLSLCDQVEQSITESLEKAQALRQSILKKAFEGSLLSEAEIEKCKAEPGWEPAEVLLERIKSEK